MSRIGKNAVPVPQGVEVKLAGQVISAKGKLGQGSVTLVDEIQAEMKDGKIAVMPRNDSRRARNMWGTSRSLVNNLVKGVATGFTENLEINGVGYRAAVQGKDLVLQLGYTHEIKYPIPTGVTMKTEKPTTISITGPDKQQVGQIAAEIRAFRPPEPYKGKGVKYESETIIRKEGKKK
ncbi:MAG TPA: 50S ribosomal protein L6 [Alphaproteobacteria bacterium]|nr:50S ribosomal protein L6 [Alphaproteobacteria bacterium]